MSGPLTTRLRRLLRASPDGLTLLELADRTGHRSSVIHKRLLGMPDVYIDRWLKNPPGRGRPYSAIWVVVVPPPNCPHPNKETAP